MEPYRLYEEAILHVHGQARQDPSVINASIISAVRGHSGDYHLTEKTRGSRLWISPLMAQYWFYDFQAVVSRNLFLDELAGSLTFRDAVTAIAAWRRKVPTRRATPVPLP